VSDETLFDIEPAALIYRRPNAVPLHKMRCRECHKRGAINGGGSAGAPHDPTRGGGYDYAICQACFHDIGDVGERARRGGISGRPIIEATP
jgi:hypothetical protein